MKYSFKRFEWVLWSTVLGVFLPAAGLHAEAPKDLPKVQEKTLHKAVYASGETVGRSAYVNMAFLLDEYKKSVAAREALRAEIKRETHAHNDRLAEMEKVIKAGDVHAQEAKQKELKLYDEKSVAYLDKKQQELFEPVLKEIQEVIKKYGVSHKYSFIYIESHPEAHDVTREILEQLNQ